MTVEELAKLTYKESPEIVEKTAAALDELEQLDPHELAGTVLDMRVIAEHACEMSKTAGVGDLAKGVLTGAATATAATVITGLGIAVATDLYNAARKGLTRGRNWKRMIDANPEIKDMAVADVRKQFNFLHTHAPDVASDPLAAGAYVTGLMRLAPGAHYGKLQELAKIQRDKADSKYAPFAMKVGPTTVDMSSKYNIPPSRGQKPGGSPRQGAAKTNHPNRP